MRYSKPAASGEFAVLSNIKPQFTLDSRPSFDAGADLWHGSTVHGGQFAAADAPQSPVFIAQSHSAGTLGMASGLLDAANDMFHFGQMTDVVHQFPSPSLSEEVAFISGIDSNGIIVAESFDSWDGDKTATYSDPSFAMKWGTPSAGTGSGTITYFFQPGSHWTASEKAVFKACLTLWSDLADVTFAQVTSASAADIQFRRGSDGGAFTDPHYSGISGSGTIGTTHLYQMTGATISIDTSVPGFGPIDGKFATAGGYVWDTILHEEGHALGLGHAGPYNGDDNPMTQQFSVYDTRLWSLMSYIDPSEAAKFSSQYPVKGTHWGTSADGYLNDPTTPMALDILALQSLYGAPATTAFSGGQTFGFHCNISDATAQFYDFTINTNPIVTIWDAGTHNTLDLSGFATKSRVNLNPGHFTSCDGHTNNICIAFSTRIDRAIGGSGNDVISGNSDANVLHGNAGNDYLLGGALNDSLAGSSGNDRVRGDTGADALSGGPGIDTFVYVHASDSTGSVFDRITDFDAATDRFNLPGSVTGSLRSFHSGDVSKATMDADLAHLLTPSRLGADHFVYLTPRTGDEAHHTFLVVDMNGHAGYQAGADLVIDVTGGSNLTDLSASSFI